jgi:large subunit ribosomal protein L30
MPEHATVTRRPRKAAPPEATGMLRIRQVRSGIGHAEKYRRTLRALGLKHHQDEVVRPDTPSVRGMVHKVRHLVRVTTVEA